MAFITFLAMEHLTPGRQTFKILLIKVHTPHFTYFSNVCALTLSSFSYLDDAVLAGVIFAVWRIINTLSQFAFYCCEKTT